MDSKLFDLEGGGGSSSRSSTNTEEEGSSAQGGTCDDGLLFLPLVALVSLYLGYLVECWHSTTRLVLVSFRSFRYLLFLSLPGPFLCVSAVAAAGSVHYYALLGLCVWCLA